VLFTEGQRVKAGQPLVEIEPRRFQLAVQAAAAAHERAQATMAEAQAGVTRREEATRSNPGLIPGEEIATWKTRVQTARAEVASAKAALDRARLDLRDSYVRAPVAGVLQTRTVNTGQYVQPGTVLATLVQRDPLMLRFDVPEAEAISLKPGMKVSFTGGADQPPTSATITLVPTVADATTRMVRVTAKVDGTADTLRAGSFARVTVDVGSPVQAVVIPQQAIRPSEKGFLAFVVVAGEKAEERVIEIGMRTQDGMVEVKKGLEAGETLVVRGAEALRTGAPVKIVPIEAEVPKQPEASR
jgi:multidrug efflux system membrane fusion protein